MKGMIFFILTRGCLLAATLASCTSADDPVPGQSSSPVGFSTNVVDPAASRALTTDNLTSMGVFASYTGPDNWNASASTMNFMYNQQVSRANNSSPWTYTPVKYWPNTATDKLSFFAYAPHVDASASGGSNPSIQGNTEAGFPKLTYTVPAAEANQTDLLASVPLLNQTYEATSGSVSFLLKHALTRVGVYIKSNDNVAGKKVTAFSITSAKSGTLTFRAPAAGNANDTGTEWTYPTPATTETFTAASATATPGFAVPDTKVADRKLLATFFLLPRGEGSTFSITYTAPGKLSTGTTLTQTISLAGQPLPSLDQWTQGTFVTYTIAIEKKQITVTAATQPTWTDSGKETVTGSYTIIYATGPADSGLSNGGTGTVDGQPVTTHTISQWGGSAEWEEDSDETVDGKV